MGTMSSLNTTSHSLSHYSVNMLGGAQSRSSTPHVPQTFSGVWNRLVTVGQQNQRYSCICNIPFTGVGFLHDDALIPFSSCTYFFVNQTFGVANFISVTSNRSKSLFSKIAYFCVEINNHTIYSYKSDLRFWIKVLYQKQKFIKQNFMIF